MGEQILLRSMLLQATRDMVPTSQRAEAILAWCRGNRAALGIAKLDSAKGLKGKQRKAAKSTASQWKRLAGELAAVPVDPVTDMPAVLVTASRLARVLDLNGAEAMMLCVTVGMSRLSKAASLAWMLRMNGIDLTRLAVDISGLKTLDALRQSRLVELGLMELKSGRSGEIDTDLGDAVWRVLRAAPESDEKTIECLVGARAETSLKLKDFQAVTADAGLIRRLLQGALAAGTGGVNILLYGPPGTGKTELAKVLSGALEADLYTIGETDEYGEEPSRWDRLTSLKLAQKVLAGRGDSLLLFDEMEDLIGEIETDNRGGVYTTRSGSKIFINRMLEMNPVAMIWTSNTIDSLDPAFLRRMSFVLKMDMPVRTARERILVRIARDEKVELSRDAVCRIANTAPEAATVGRTALRGAHLAGGGAADAQRITESLVTGLRHGRRLLPEVVPDRELDLALYAGSTDIEDLFKRLTKSGAPADFSLLMTGPPGTGKTALAQYLADGMDRPLMVKRASDILSPWVGETEHKIAEAFAKAVESGAVLLFDEIDSLLFNRQNAARSWEVTQVNELLTWMDTHSMPFIAATNHAEKLDPAAMRRFVFKVELQALTADKAAMAFQTFFGEPAPARLTRLDGLTPGDFAVVARQLRFRGKYVRPDVLVDLLEAELKAKPAGFARIGF